MIVDLETNSDVPPLTYDLCIVGTGAAGLALASRMLGTSVRVLILESGGLDHEPATQALYDVDIGGLPHRGSTEGRFRVWGGSTTRWGGQALPLMPLDFERRDWVAHSGWPLTFADVEPYYPDACRFLGVDALNFDTDLFSHLRTPLPRFDPQRLWYHFSKWSPQPDIRRHWVDKVAASETCTLLLHANVTDIRLNADMTRVESLSARTLGGRTIRAQARAFAICVGGIETARLLLASNSQMPAGVGNQHDLVGRFFQDHVWAGIGTLRSGDAAQALFNVFHKGGLKYSVRSTAAPEWQRANRTLNMSMQMLFLTDTASAVQDLKDLYVALRRRRTERALVRKFLRVVRHPVSVLTPAWHYVVNGRSYVPGARVTVGVACEQEPNPESRVLLSHGIDKLGMRRAEVRWTLTDLTRSSLRTFTKVLAEELPRAGVGPLDLEPWLFDEGGDWTAHVTDQFHHMGTARMHHSPRHGVADADCQVHEISNLFLGGSALFPTGGHSNPTLTLIALGLRLGDKLKRDLVRSAGAVEIVR